MKAHETTVPPIVTADAVLEMAQLARTVHVDPSVNDYVSRLVEPRAVPPRCASA